MPEKTKCQATRQKSEFTTSDTIGNIHDP